MINIRNSIGSYSEITKAFTSPESSRLDDIRFIQQLVGRSVLPRHFIFDKGDETFEFIAQNKTIVAFKTAGAKNSVGALKGFKLVDFVGDPELQYDIVRTYINDFGQLGNDDQLTIKRVGEGDRKDLPMIGVDISQIDFTTSGAPQEPKLRVVVNNERPPVEKSEAVAQVSPVVAPKSTAGETTSDDAEPDSDILTTFFDRLKAHVIGAQLIDMNGDTEKEFGVNPELNADVLGDLTSEFSTWNTGTSRGIGDAHKLVIVGSGKSDEEILIAVVGEERLLIAQAEFMKLGRVLMGWNALITARTGK